MQSIARTSAVALAAVLFTAQSLAQTREADIRGATQDAVKAIRSLRLVAKSVRQGDTQYLTVVLAGGVEWPRWRYHVRQEGADGRTIERIVTYDAGRASTLQMDGLGGSVANSNAPEQFMSFIGIYLSNLGLGTPVPRSLQSWLTIFDSPRITITDIVGRPGVVLLRDAAGLDRELDAAFGFMPTKVRFWNASDETVAAMTFSDYRRVGPLWLPYKLDVEGKTPEVTTILEASANFEVTDRDFQIAMPYGTSVLLEAGDPRIVGVGSIDETIEALNVWNAYGSMFGRVAARITPGATSVSVVGTIDKALFASGALALLAVLIDCLRRRSRVIARTAALFVVGFAGNNRVAHAQEPAAPEPNHERLSAVNSAYVVIQQYGRSVDWSVLDREVGQNPGLSAIREKALTPQQIHSYSCRPTLEELSRWPNPAIVMLKPRRTFPYERCVVLVGHNEHGFTLIDPHPFGRLAPFSDEEFAGVWTGDALLTSPVPIEFKSPMRMWAILAAAIGLLAIVFRLGLARRAVGSGMVALLVLTIGCAGAPATPPSSKSADVSIDPPNWQAGDQYPTTVSRVFNIRNSGTAPVSVTKAVPSCGCMASGLPKGARIDAGSSLEFTLRITLKGRSGPLKHTMRLDFSNGDQRTIEFTALVKRGVYAEPELLEPSETASSLSTFDVSLRSDDSSEFDVTSATCASRAVRASIDGKVVRVMLVNNNRESVVRDTLVISTSHPQAPAVNVPIIARFKLSWQIEPKFFNVSSDAGDSIEREVEIKSLTGVAFTVKLSDSDLAQVTPKSNVASVAQTVALRVKRPSLSDGPVRLEIPVQTTLPDATEIVVPFLFYK